MTEETKIGLELLRAPFESHQIGKLPKPTKAQTDEVKKDFKKGIRCDICKQWHHPKVIHLDYVGHAALTDRLLDCDPKWNWAPFSVDDNGQPCLLPDGSGMWINLTVCGMTRPGFGDAGNKKGGDAIKEIIGDALRNAGMRFGMALDLWHKGDLHLDEDGGPPGSNVKVDVADEKPPQTQSPNIEDSAKLFNEMYLEIDKCTEAKTMAKWFAFNAKRIATGLNDNDKTRLRALYKEYAEIFKKEQTG